MILPKSFSISPENPQAMRVKNIAVAIILMRVDIGKRENTSRSLFFTSYFLKFKKKFFIAGNY
jgi:hypothetical protein